MNKVVFFLLTLSWLNCQGQDTIPKELKFSFEFLNQRLDSNEIELLKKTPEDEFTENYHRGLGAYLRNNLLRHHPKSDTIILFFNSLGVHHIDDISHIILISYQRYLNKKNIELQAQADWYVEYWKPILECKKNQRIRAAELYNRFQIGDTINIKMPVNEHNSATDYPCSRWNLEWEFDGLKDLSINGIIIDKYNINSQENVFFKIKILSKNHSNTRILMKEAPIGNELNVCLTTAWKIQ